MSEDGADEIADGLVVLDDIFIAIENKEREVLVTTPENETRWFLKKLKEASKRLRKVHTYACTSRPIIARNRAGDTIEIPTSPRVDVLYLAIFNSHESLPWELYRVKQHVSKTTGEFIHIFHLVEYRNILKLLITPIEICSYLKFRRALLERFPRESMNLSEKAIAGQYLSGNFDWLPEESFSKYVDELIVDTQKWNISHILHRFRERTFALDQNPDYYRVLKELAMMKRSFLRMFLERFNLAFELARDGELRGPFRFAAPQQCGYVFAVCPQDLAKSQMNGLRNFTLATKYELRLPRCVGVSFLRLDDGSFSVLWALAEFDWEPDEIWEERCSPENNPFLPLKTAKVFPYEFEARS